MRDIRGNSNYTDSKRKAFQFYSITGARIDQQRADATYFDGGSYKRIASQDLGNQYERRRGDFVYKHLIEPNRVNYFTAAKQFPIQGIERSWNVEEVGVGSVKALPRKKVKKIYLPETDNKGVDCTDLSIYLEREQRTTGYYKQKRTSSKCVGGVIEPTKEVLNEKLSPIIKTKSGATSPKMLANNVVETKISQSNMFSMTIKNNEFNKVETFNEKEKCSAIDSKSLKKYEKGSFNKRPDKNIPDVIVTQNKQSTHNKVNIDKMSSDSLLQHVHNLENISNEMLDYPWGSNLENEYNENSSSKKDEKILDERKPIPEVKTNVPQSTSFFRSRFEALRRGLGKKRDLKTSSVLLSATTSYASHKDVSISSDPPSLEAHSYSSMKVYSPYHDISTPKYRTKYNSLISDNEDIDSQSVKGMFKLWGAKFNLDEDAFKSNRKYPQVSKYDSNNSNIVDAEKKSGKKFSFFRKKSKNKMVTERPEKGVTAGRCEVKDGLTIKTDAKAMKPLQEGSEPMHEQVLEDYVDKLRRAWLQKFVFTNNESRRSVKIRWNNKTYATSSSTIFELMDNVFKESGVVFRSQSDTTLTEETSHRSFRKPRVNFLTDVEAWMIPNTTTKLKVPTYRQSKEIADTKEKRCTQNPKLFPRNIELVLHSKDFVRINQNSSDCLKINIPKDFFSESEGRRTSSDEKVYNVVEYETTNSLATRKIIQQDGYNKCMQTDFTDTSDKTIKTNPVHRDAMLQGSVVNLPKRCEVVGVGIITQRDNGQMKNTTMRIQDEFTDDDESEENVRLGEKKCEFAESYMHDYYREWTSLGIDLFSWCTSDSHVRDSSVNPSNSSLYEQGDRSKSCPIICEDFQTLAIVSSCNTSSSSRYNEPVPKPKTEPKKSEEKVGSKFFEKFKKRSKSAGRENEVRVLPKDSKEVFKRRKIYAKSNRAQWLHPDPVSSKESKDRRKLKKISYSPETIDNEKVNEIPVTQHKHERKLNDGILSFKDITDSDIHKEKTYPDNEKVLPEPPPRKPGDDPGERIQSSTRIPNTPEAISSNITPKRQSLKQSASLVPQLSARPSPQRTPCQSPLLKSSPLSTTGNSPKASLENSPVPKCLPKFPKMPLPTSPKSKIPIKKQTSPKQLSNLPQQNPPLNTPIKTNAPNIDSPLTCSGSAVPVKTPSPNVCSKCKNPDCGKESPKKKVTKRSSNSSPNVVTATKSTQSVNQISSSQILEKKDRPPQNTLKPTTPTPPFTKIPTPPKRPPSPLAQSEIGGISEKIKPSTKKSSNSKELLAQESSKPNVIRLNSKEAITIRKKPDSPSITGIRDGYDVKVKDEDGITLYERKKYQCKQKTLGVLRDIFNDSNIRPVSTDSPVRSPSAEKVLGKRDLSVLNLIEIQLNLKVTQGDKATEINIGNSSDTRKGTEENTQEKKSNQDVHVLTGKSKNKENYVADDDIPNNDINIRILIKNFNPKVEKKSNVASNDHDYYKKNTETYQTVSTAYSPIKLNQSPKSSRVLSVHRATTDLSMDETKSKLSQEIASDTFTDDHCTVSTFNATKEDDDEQCSNRVKNDDVFLENVTFGADSTVKLTDELQFKFNFENEGNTSVTDTDEPSVTVKFYDNENVSLKSTDEMTNHQNKAHKKDLLKMVMEEASYLKKGKNKQKIRKLKNILKSILTSDSEPDDITAASKELITNLACSTFLNKTDSMGNYYNFGGYKVNQLYPSKESCGNDSVSTKGVLSREGCLCSTFARKLNLCGNENEGVCCCRKPQISSETVSCHLMNEDSTNVSKESSVVGPEYSQTVQLKTVSGLSMWKSVKSDSSKKLMEESKSGLVSKFLPFESPIKECATKNLNRSNNRSLNKADEVVVVTTEANKAQSNQTSKMSKFASTCRKSQVANFVTSSHILQSYDVKKAVLKIYAQKMVTSDGEKLIAKLPKFVYDKENELKEEYEEICESSYQNVCKGNLVMMSVRR